MPSLDGGYIRSFRDTSYMVAHKSLGRSGDDYVFDLNGLSYSPFSELNLRNSDNQPVDRMCQLKCEEIQLD